MAKTTDRTYVVTGKTSDEKVLSLYSTTYPEYVNVELTYDRATGNLVKVRYTKPKDTGISEFGEGKLKKFSYAISVTGTSDTDETVPESIVKSAKD